VKWPILQVISERNCGGNGAACCSIADSIANFNQQIGTLKLKRHWHELPTNSYFKVIETRVANCQVISYYKVLQMSVIGVLLAIRKDFMTGKKIIHIVQNVDEVLHLN
jgi:hypothetical protein